MSNAETLQQHNQRINVNNDELASILITINKLPTVKEEKLQDKVVEPSTTEQTITADEEYTGLGSVTVNAVTNEIDSNIVAENIKDGVEILGVTGTLQEGITPTGTLDITENGEYDVTEYANASVNIEGAGGKYAPRVISFRNYNGTDLDYEVANLDTSNVTNMEGMFYYCSQLTSLDVSNFNTSNVTNMKDMFYYCSGLTSLDVTNFDTTKVTNMRSMFVNCANLTSLDVSSFNTSDVTDMYSMFDQCYKLETLNLVNFDTSKVTNMAHMFRSYAYYKEASLDLSTFNTSNVTNMSRMFYQCNNLTSLDIRNFTFDKVTNYDYMFHNIPADCLIIVKSDTEKQWILTNGRSDLTNVKTVAEYEAS